MLITITIYNNNALQVLAINSFNVVLTSNDTANKKI